MKVTRNWLKQFVDFDWSDQELAERLTMSGMEVESLEKVGGEFEGVVVAQVITRDKHPNADKLSLCRVNDGRGERQIVCGAQNFKAGDKVPLILPGFSLPDKPGEPPMTIKVGKIRGCESQGMMCSPQELGFPEAVEGLLILREDARVGQPFAEYLGRRGGDVVYDLEITPNRPDLNSVIGIARELAAVGGNPLKMPEVRLVEGTPVAQDLVAVRLLDDELCPRYTARVLRGVKIGASPEWLRSLLEKVGVRSINNVVDVTNYVMLETGQPLHAFDYRLLGVAGAPGQSSPPTIVVRRAAEGEAFQTLDGQRRTLTNEMLVIADSARPLALAGVMGGQNSEISLNTVDVLLESACFLPRNIRATSKKLELRTESSYRFERGADIGICDWASRRASQLMLETAGGTLAGGLVDAYPNPPAPRQITLRPEKVNQLLGLELRTEEVEYYLDQLELKVAGRKPRPVDAPPANPEPVTVTIPTFRVDLKREVDLIEEVGRLHGVDKIPATPPRGATGSNPFDGVHDLLSDARRILVGLGLCEAQGQTLIGEAAARRVTNLHLVPLANPLSADMNVLRPSLLPGLLDTLRHNLSHRNQDVAVFEIGRVFSSPAAASSNNSGGRPSGGVLSKSAVGEERRLAIALTGLRSPLFWSGPDREAKYDLYDLKGVLESFFEAFGVRGITLARRPPGAELWLESAALSLGKFSLGELGELQPAIRRQMDLRDPVLLAELNLDTLLARRNPARFFKPLPAFPSSRRDIAMLVSENTTHEDVLQVLRQAKPANLETAELFDIFRGKSVLPGQKSMAYAFTYRHPERTLIDAEINAAHQKLVECLRERLHAVVRE